MGRMVSSVFFLLKKEPMVLSELIESGPCIPVEALKACALIGLHIMAEENALRSDSGSSPDFGDRWRYGCPQSRVWGSNAWAGSEGNTSLEHYEHNVGNLAVEVVGQNWSSEVVSLSLFLEDWQAWRMARVNGQEKRDACRESSESLGSPRALCSACQEGRRRCSDALVPFFKVRPGLQAGYSFEHFVPSSE